MTTPPKRALLLVNLGTPAAPDTAAVRTYLREFLSDPRVISIPGPARWLLLNLIILPTRPKRSAAAYQKVWTDEGSPLLVETQKLTAKVRDVVHAQIDPDIVVECAMRYGQPALEPAIDRLIEAGVTELVVMPLYPQYASATTGSTVERVQEILANKWVSPAVQFIGEFCDHPSFIAAQSDIARPLLKDFAADHVVFSFHGVPEEHIFRGDPKQSHCLKAPECCDQDVPSARLCYRAHCFRTARALAASLDIGEDAFSVTFQSRLGRAKWLEPATEPSLEKLAAAGHKRVAVFSPAFIADCLETIEELGIEAKEAFLHAGGEDFLLVPCVNSTAAWAEGVVDIVATRGGFGAVTAAHGGSPIAPSRLSVLNETASSGPSSAAS